MQSSIDSGRGKAGKAIDAPLLVLAAVMRLPERATKVISCREGNMFKSTRVVAMVACPHMGKKCPAGPSQAMGRAACWKGYSAFVKRSASDIVANAGKPRFLSVGPQY